MTYKEMLAGLRAGDMKPIYLLAGDEPYLIEKLERAILARVVDGTETDGIQMLSGEVGGDELVALIETAPFFSDRNVVLVRNTTLFKEKKKNAGGEKAEDRLLAVFSDMPPYTTLILETPDKADKRRKLYKAVAKYGAVAEVAQLRPWEVKDWLGGKLTEIGRRFDRGASEYFLEAVSVMQSVSLGYLDQEIEKLALYTQNQTITKQDLLEVMTSVPEVSVFAMLDSISDKNLKKALVLLEEQLAAGVHPLRILTMLGRHTRQLWQAKRLSESGAPAKRIAEELGLVPFIAEKLAAKSRRFEEKTLENALVLLADADYKLKSGQADAALLERILIEVCA